MSAPFRAASTSPQGARPVQRTHSYYTPPQLTTDEIISGVAIGGLAPTVEQIARAFTTCDFVRVPLHGKPQSNTSGSIKVTHDLNACHWQNFATDEKGTVFANSKTVYDAAVIARSIQANKEQKARREAAQGEQHAKAAKHAQAIYRHGAITGTHLYIDDSQLSGLHNARLDVSTGALLIPMWVYGVGLVNVQRIFQDGAKRFLKGGRVKGAYSVIGSLDDAGRVLLVEGWATGCTLRELEGLPVAVAFSANNLTTVAQVLRAKFPAISIVVCGDDDRQIQGNVGRSKAIQAADSVGGTVAFPELCKCCRCSDFADANACARRSGRG